jgi:hypothetical protein
LQVLEDDSFIVRGDTVAADSGRITGYSEVNLYDRITSCCRPSVSYRLAAGAEAENSSV